MVAQKKSYISPPRTSISPLPPPTQFASSANNASAYANQAQSSVHASETDAGKNAGEQYSTFSSSSNAAKSASTGKFFSYSKATKSETISSKSQQTKSSTNIGSGSVHGGVQVLPVAALPVKLEEPPPQPAQDKVVSSSSQIRNQGEFQNRSYAKAGKSYQKSVDSIEADQFIEQLMREAETDPKLRELTYGKSNVKPDNSEPLKSIPATTSVKTYPTPKPPAPPPPTGSPMLNESYPMIQRPYRTQQDMIIKDRDDSPTNLQRISNRPMERHKMQKRPYRTNEDIKIVDMSERSKSADGRLNNSAFQKKDPKLDNFSTASSVENVAGATGSRLLGEVVTDNDHHSVRDLVRMIETNTNSESVNPYIRKWGCDLISPEPHSKNITFRREKREMPKPFVWKAPVPGAGFQSDDPRFASHYSAEQSQMDQNAMTDVSYISGDNTNTTVENEFNMNDHITDMNSLLGRPPGNALNRYEDEILNQTGSSCMSKLGGVEDESYSGPQRTETPVIWPPPSPTPQEVDGLHNGIQGQSPIPPSPPPPPPALLLTQDLQEKAKRQELSQSPPKFGRGLSSSRVAETRGTVDNFSNHTTINNNVGTRNSLSEIDKQIVTIQNEFEAELDTLIDAYRKLQQTKRKEGVTVEGTAFNTSF